MRQVSLEYIQITDFKSFIGENDICLSEGPGLKYVSGVNNVVPRLGSNGAGKTTVWDAVVWCWTGYSIRGHRASDLAPWGVNRAPTVITCFNIDGVGHYIERSGSPNRLFIDGVPAEQVEVDALLLSRDRLLHSVIFGQSVEFFLNLSMAKRGELLDQVLNLDLWLKLADKAAAKAVVLDKRCTKLLSDITYNTGLQTAYRGQETAILQTSQTWERDWKAQIDLDTRAMKTAEYELANAHKRLGHLKSMLEVAPEIQGAIAQIKELSDLLLVARRKVSLCQEHIEQNDYQHDFFHEHTTCPTCQQAITPELRQTKLNHHFTTSEGLKLQYQKLLEEEAALSAQHNEWEHYYKHEQARYNNIENEVALAAQDIAYRQKDIKAKTLAIHTQMINPNNPHTEQLQEIINQIAIASGNIAALDVEHKAVKGQQLKYEYWKTGFRKVRLYQVKQVITRLQLETANAASALGIGDWLIEYSTEVETKSGTIKAGIHITVKTPSGNIVVEDSGGEEQRVRLAVSMGLSALIQNMAGIMFTFEVWDEPSTWLSVEGIDDLLDQLKDRADSLGKSVWLLDHNVLTYPDFTEVWRVTKDSNGSRMIQIADGV